MAHLAALSPDVIAVTVVSLRLKWEGKFAKRYQNAIAERNGFILISRAMAPTDKQLQNT